MYILKNGFHLLLMAGSLILTTTACRAKRVHTGDSTLESTSGESPTQPMSAGKKFLNIKDAETAASIFDNLKAFDAQKSTKTTRVWQGKAEVECQVSTFEGTTETGCWMKPIPLKKHEYVYNFTGLNAEIIFDFMDLNPQELAEVKSKSTTGTIRLESTQTEFSLSVVP